jgi:deoxyribodipyrimidine photo-lyase
LSQAWALNIPLLIRNADHWDDAPAVLLDLCRQLNVDAVHFNEEYGLHESRRDAAVAAAQGPEASTPAATWINCCSSPAAY